jgi:hypothetical protein
MKIVFTDLRAIAHIWANQTQIEARNAGRNFYFSGPTIYSYGSHFPIATILEKDGEKFCIMTNRTYSNTTSKHIQIVRHANNLPTIFCENVPIGYKINSVFSDKIDSYFHSENIKAWESKLKFQFGKLANARKKEIYILEIQRIAKQLEKYLTFFDLKAPKHLKLLLSSTDSAEFTNYLESEKNRIAKDKAKALKIQKLSHFESLTKWRSFEFSRLSSRFENVDYLRYNAAKNRIETSQHIEIPLQIGLNFWDKIQSIILSGGCVSGGCGDKLGKFMDAYEIKEITAKHIVIGCHCILISEIKNLLKNLPVC